MHVQPALIPIHITGLVHSPPEAGGAPVLAPPLVIQLPLKGLTIKDIECVLNAEGYRFVNLELQVGANVRVDASTTNHDLKNLSISSSTSLIEFHDQWTREKGIKEKGGNLEKSPAIFNEQNYFQAESATVYLSTTLRVASGQGNKLPQGVGQVPLYPLSKCHNVPDALKRRGGFIAPLWQSEALTFSFSSHQNSPAIKISVKGINALTGKPINEKQRSEAQDYISATKQPWLDGITKKPGVTEQFVAAPLSSSVLDEPSSSSTNSGSNPSAPNNSEPVNGIQFDFFRRLDRHATFKTDDGRSFTGKDLWRTPKELGLKPGEVLQLISDARVHQAHYNVPQTLEAYINDSTSQLHFKATSASLVGDIQLYVRSPQIGFYHGDRQSAIIPVRANENDTVATLLEKLKEHEGGQAKESWLEVPGAEGGDNSELDKKTTIKELGLEERSFLILKHVDGQSRDYDNRWQARSSGVQTLFGSVTRSLGFGAAAGAPVRNPAKGVTVHEGVELGRGGKVEQRIIADDVSVRAYSTKPSTRVFVHVVSPKEFERLTLRTCPASAVTRAVYRSHGIPWEPRYGEGAPEEQVEKLDEEDDGKVWSHWLEEDAVAPLRAPPVAEKA
ncbi:hypothetical protein T439DRAFT_378064 [Meredithblackwellia eburnea MCA 4105]